MGYVIFTAVICAGVLFYFYERRMRYREIDRLLDCVLNQEEITGSEMKEGEFSALVGKIGRIRRMMERQVECAKEEKEQVKSLVSDMSHQLKTPLAGLSIYADILGEGRLDEERMREVTWKMKKQVEKLDWIIGSLGKMVKLEQDAIAFETEELFIRQTISDAVDAVYEKMEKKGIHIPVCAGIMPITSAKQIGTTISLSGSSVPKRLSDLIAAHGDNAEDMRKAGIDYAICQIRDLQENGVNHIHIYTMNKPGTAAEIVQAIYR